MKKFHTYSLFLITYSLSAMTFAAEAEKPKYVDPNRFASYKVAMESTASHPLAVNWSQCADKTIAAMTEESVLAEIVDSEENAMKLLNKVQPAYRSDPLVLTQIAAVTQWVLGKDPCWLWFWMPSPSAGREVWIAALQRKIAESDDQYIRIFCKQQLELVQY